MYRQFKKVLILCLLGLATQSPLEANNLPSTSWIAKTCDFFWNRQNSALTTPGKIALGAAAVGFGLWKLYKAFKSPNLLSFNRTDAYALYNAVVRGEAGEDVCLKLVHQQSVDVVSDYDKSMLRDTLIKAVERNYQRLVPALLDTYGHNLTPANLGDICVHTMALHNNGLHDLCLNFFKQKHQNWQQEIARSIFYSLPRSSNEPSIPLISLNKCIEDEVIHKYIKEFINAEPGYRSALHTMVQRAQEKPFENNPFFGHIEWLLQQGADPFNTLDTQRKSVLDYLTFHENNLKVISHIRDLIFKNREIDSKINPSEFCAMTGLPNPLYNVVSDYIYNDNQEVLFVIYKNNPEKLQYLLENGYSPNVCNDENKSALMYAVQWNRQDCVEKLIKTPGIEIDAQDVRGMTALMFAAENGDTQTIEFILNATANKAKSVNIQTRSSNIRHRRFRRRFPPRYARRAEQNQQPTVNDVPDSTEFEFFRDIGNTSALMFAAMYGKEKAVELLLQHGADRNIADDDNKTALNYAEENGHDGIVKLLNG